MTYEGDLLGLLNPFALLCGLVSCAMLVMHGGAYLALKADQPVADRAAAYARFAAIFLLALFIIAGDLRVGSAWKGTRSRVISSHDGPSNPLLKTVARVPRGLLSNYRGASLDADCTGIGFCRRRLDDCSFARSASGVRVDRERRGCGWCGRDGGA